MQVSAKLDYAVRAMLELAAAALQRAVGPLGSGSSGPSPDRDDLVSVGSTTVDEAPTGS